MPRRPLRSRPLDLLYFLFFIFHIPASLVVDLQYFYPQRLVPAFLKQIIPLYLQKTGDPLIAGLHNWYNSDAYVFTWFKTFVWLELLFQVPVFIIGARALWKDSPRIYIPLILYGASTATTTLACITTILAVPTVPSPDMAYQTVGITDAQRIMHLSSYFPFFLIPLVMAVDMGVRVSGMMDYPKMGRVNKGEKVN